MQDGRYVVSTVTVPTAVPRPGATAVPPAPAPAAQSQPAPGTVVQGTVVRVVGKDQVILRTAEGKEVIVYVSPQTTYTFNEQPGQFTDLRPGADIRVNYDVRDRRNMARGVFGLPPRKR